MVTAVDKRQKGFWDGFLHASWAQNGQHKALLGSCWSISHKYLYFFLQLIEFLSIIAISRPPISSLMGQPFLPALIPGSWLKALILDSYSLCANNTACLASSLKVFSGLAVFGGHPVVDLCLFLGGDRCFKQNASHRWHCCHNTFIETNVDKWKQCEKKEEKKVFKKGKVQ